MPGINNCTRGVGFPELLHLTVPYDMNIVQGGGVLFSMLPVSLMILFFFVFVFTRRIQFIILFSLGGLASAINQFVLKPMSEQPRPPESCLKDTDGFPSGHSVNALSVWAFIVLQELFNYKASHARRGILIIIYTVIFTLNGPARNVVKDHTWLQIGVGMGAGVIWGTVVWCFFRFIVVRFWLEKLMCSKFGQKIGLVNDLDPDYRHSKYHGSINSSKHAGSDPMSEQQQHETDVIGKLNFYHGIFIVAELAIGITGMALSKYGYNCSRAVPGLVFSQGLFSVLDAVAATVVAYLITRKFNSKDWSPLIVHSCLIFICALLLQGLCYIYLILDSQRKDGCDIFGSSGAVYSIAWLAVQIVVIILTAVFWFWIKLPRAYSSHYEYNQYAPVPTYGNKINYGP